MKRVALIPLLIALGASAAAPDPVSDVPAALRSLLSTDLRFSVPDLTALEKGDVVAHRLGATAPGEAGAGGAVRIAGRKEAFVDLYRDIVQFKRGPGVVAIGLFGDPPSEADLASLELNALDVNLKDCVPGDCDIRLPAQAIRRFQSEVDWKSPDADARAAALFKQILAEHVRAYMSGSPGRFTEYNDEKRPVRPVDDFAALLKGASYLERLVPGLPSHLESFPASPLPGAEDIVYWSKERFGNLAPFVTVTHVTITHPTPASFVIASKDVYSSRYFDASLSVTIADDAAAGPEAFYLVYVNRSRADALKGSFAGLRRSIVERRARNSTEENLRATRLRMEKSSR